MSSSLRSAALILLSCFLLVSTATAFNITKLLGRYPEFSNFNDLLSKTELVREINSRKTITVLAVSNDALGGLSSKPEEVQKAVLSNHVVLDYYDILKLQKMKNRNVLTTLYQTTGVASEGQGFLDVTHKKDGSIVFGSAVKGSPQDTKLLGSVAAQPYNISVLSVSQPIVAPGMDGSLSPFASPPKASAPAPTPAHKKKAPPPADAPAPSDGPTADAPAPSDGPTADAPAPSDGPTADAPAPSDGPTSDAPTADTDDKPHANAAGKLSGASFGLAVVLASFLAL
ncbi:Fasciclin-like arabinogalactan protein 3 [Abeliophyllum distichum]|uniref:Fasciclin-like arabinogalactan protein 3 n=1 Tax=Abeliophyllum distichum TaxID=126358 RepID=A0ABD1TXL1_9LAMI